MSSVVTTDKRPYVHVPHVPLWWKLFGIPAIFLLFVAVWIAGGLKMPDDGDEDDEDV